MLPLFKSHYSIGKSILTFAKAGETEKNLKGGPSSIIDIAIEEKIKPLFVVEDSMAGFMEAYTNCSAAEIPLVYGYRVRVTAKITEKNEDSLKTESKIIIMARNSEGFYDLCKLATISAVEGFYYAPRIDYETLNKKWTKNLDLIIPFYDSFLFKNSFYVSQSIPDFSVITPTFFIEKNDLPFDNILTEKIKSFTAGKYETVNTKSIYYKERRDFKSYVTYRCIHNRSTLAKPELEHLSSPEFCLESWKEQNV